MSASSSSGSSSSLGYKGMRSDDVSEDMSFLKSDTKHVHVLRAAIVHNENHKTEQDVIDITSPSFEVQPHTSYMIHVNVSRRVHTEAIPTSTNTSINAVPCDLSVNVVNVPEPT
uniref:Sporulation kinase B n=1 Tax=Lygus hesperus TaxID=30085 RepID=A0A0A9Z3X1_LYGHE